MRFHVRLFLGRGPNREIEKWLPGTLLPHTVPIPTVSRPKDARKDCKMWSTWPNTKKDGVWREKTRLEINI